MKNIALLILFISCTYVPTQKLETTKQNIDQQKPEPIAQNGSSLEKNVVQVEEDKPIHYQTLTKKNSATILDYCEKLDLYFKKYNWGRSQCEHYSWHHVRSSYWGNPIMWFVYGDESKIDSNEKINTTMILCGVHGDEITPVKFCFDILEDLQHHPQLFKDNLVVIAPLVTPDSFLKKKPTRTNARGIDVNRNFPTKDWNEKALKLWENRYRRDIRRFPGKKALSEQETIFQVNLIKRYKPNKVISVHAPLTLLDYDGPSHNHGTGKSAKQLLLSMSDSAGNYKVIDYPFFTGSLGNWAGNERNIPTITLELPNSDWNKTDRYFEMFRDAIHKAIAHPTF